jgi:betaine lipid synthase
MLKLATNKPKCNEKLTDQIGGGTGYNIEAMAAYVNVPEFFSSVYLVDFSPSLCEIARQRFERLGWDVKVVCQDARAFRLEDHEPTIADEKGIVRASSPITNYFGNDAQTIGGADLITLS